MVDVSARASATCGDLFDLWIPFPQDFQGIRSKDQIHLRESELSFCEHCQFSQNEKKAPDPFFSQRKGFSRDGLIGLDISKQIAYHNNLVVCFLFPSLTVGACKNCFA